MILLYTAQAPNGYKASIALEELGLDYEVKRLALDRDEQFTPEFLALNPNNKIPVIDDDGQVVWESGAILLYLAEKYDSGAVILPKDSALRIAAIQYTFFQVGGIGPNLGRLAQAVREENAHNTEIFSNEVDRLLGVIESVLSDGREGLAGPYSIADIMHFGWLKLALDLKLPLLMKREPVVEWLERIAARPAVQRGMLVPQ